MILLSNRSLETSKCGKNTSDTLGYPLVCHFLKFLPYFDVICGLFLNRRTATEHLLVTCTLRLRRIIVRYITISTIYLAE